MTMPDRLSNYNSLTQRLSSQTDRLYDLVSKLGGSFPTPRSEVDARVDAPPSGILLDEFSELNRQVTFALDQNEAVLAQLDQLLNSNVTSIASAAHGGFAAGRR